METNIKIRPSTHSRIRLSHCGLASLLFVSALAFATPFAYVSISSSYDVSVIDTASNNIVATVPQGGGGVIVANAAGTRVL